MARLKQRGSEVGLREYLLEWEVDFRNTYGSMAPEFWEALSPAVDALVGGEAYSFPRYLLPDDHPARREGNLHDRLVLTEDDRLVLADVRTRAE